MRPPGRSLVPLLLAGLLLAACPAASDPEAPLPLPDITPMPSNPDSRPFTEPDLEVSLVASGALPAAGPAVIVFRLRNTGGQAKRVCTLFTPFEQRDRFTLEVRDARGAELPLTTPKQPGPMAGPEDHVELAPGQALEARVDLRQDFALPPGRYTVRFRGAGLVNHLPDSPPLTLEIPAS